MPANQVLSTAISLAKEITKNSPDAVQSTKVALLLAQKYGVEETFHTHIRSSASKRVYEGDNIKVCLVFTPFFGILLSWIALSDDPL